MVDFSPQVSISSAILNAHMQITGAQISGNVAPAIATSGLVEQITNSDGASRVSLASLAQLDASNRVITTVNEALPGAVASDESTPVSPGHTGQAQIAAHLESSVLVGFQMLVSGTLGRATISMGESNSASVAILGTSFGSAISGNKISGVPFDFIVPVSSVFSGGRITAAINAAPLSPTMDPARGAPALDAGPVLPCTENAPVGSGFRSENNSMRNSLSPMGILAGVRGAAVLV